ncbi:Peptidase M1 N-terminal domain [Popillia japonica]|uniref:Aminopeptidase n=1 Tax=Popillia japonica TaxID=7064 RepID=A0AAW1LR15_POPJA
MVGYYSQGVPSVDLQNNGNQKKYTVNRGSSGDISISKPVCALFVMGAIVLAAVAAVITYFLAPSCSGHSLPASLTRGRARIEEDEPSVKYISLPRSVVPVHYRLYILPKLETDFTTFGNVTIKLKINEKTDEILLNALDLKINEHSVSVRRLKDGKFIKVLGQKYIEDSQGYSIHLEQSLSVQDEYELFMEFTGTLNDYMVGFYRSHYFIKDSNTSISRWIASTQFSPTDARRAFPCFDEPSFKAKFTISIARPSNMSTLSNMPLKDSTVIASDNITWDNYNETPLMSSYLVAFTVHDFAPYRHGVNKSFKIWTRQNLLDYAQYAFEVGPRMLSFFENYFGIKYPLPKIDVVALPDFGFNAMENWGLITFRESGLLLDRLSSTISHNRAVSLTLGHELAHFWFGNLVTPKGWDDLWLKEGFSTYFEYLAVDKIHPDWQILDEFFYDQTYTAMRTDRFISSRPIHFKVENSNDIRQVFDAISYSKGASLVNQVANILGEDTFKEGLRKFLNNNSFANADHDDLWDALTEQAHIDGALDKNLSMRVIMKGWIDQAGFPVVTVTPDYEKNVLKFSQRRFILNGKVQTKSDESWWIPISYTTNNNTKLEDGKPKFWLDSYKEESVNLTHIQWYLVNLKQNYYIVNYDEKNWKALSDMIMYLPPVIRAQLVGDSMNLARAGIIDYSIPLNLIKVIGAHDRDIIFVPLELIFSETDFLYNILFNTPAFGVYEKYFWTIFNFPLETVDFDESPSERYIKKRIRRLVLPQACRKPNEKCAITARQIFRSWKDNNYRVFPNIRSVVYCTAIRDGDDEDWEFAYNQYLKALSVSEKQTILSALGCSSKHWMLSKYLEMMISNTSGIRKQDGSVVFDAVASNIYGHNLAFDFIRNKWKEINEYFGEGFRTVSRMVESLPTFMNTPEHLKQLEIFRDENKYNLKATNRAFTNTIEKVKTNIQWMKLNYKSVESWLKQQVQHYQI